MRYIFLTLFVCTFFVASAQVSVSNVRTSLSPEGALVIQYDVQGIASSDSVYIAVNGLKSGRLSPITVTGDVGNRITSGKDKTIYWSLVKDAYKINESLVATVLVKLSRNRLPQSAPTVGAAGRTRPQAPIAQMDPVPTTPNQPVVTTPPTTAPAVTSSQPIEKNLEVESTTPKKKPDNVAAAPTKPTVARPTSTPTSVVRTGGGPANALLSALAPGVGNIFVQPDHRIGARPAITVAYVGLLIYGITQNGKSKTLYDEYKALPRTTDENTADAAYAKANSANHTAILCVGGAVAIWAIDVTATLLRGLKNQRAGSVGQLTPPRTQFSATMIGPAPALVFKHTF